MRWRWIVVVIALFTIVGGVVAAPFLISDNSPAQALFGIITTAISTFVGVWASWNYSKNSDKERLTRYGLLAWRNIDALSVKVRQQIQYGSANSETLESWMLDVDIAKLAWMDLLHDVFEVQGRLKLESEEVSLEYKKKINAAADGRVKEELFGELMLAKTRIQSRAPLPIVEKEYLSKLALQDALTGLPNRAAFDNRASDLSARNIPYVIALLDLDGFKKINDSSGHARGNELLFVVADAIKKHLASADIIARFGGDEFTAIFRDSTPDTVATLLTAFIAALPQHTEQAGFPAMTASCGVSSNHMKEYGLKLQDADQAMFHAKQEGGARVSLAD